MALNRLYCWHSPLLEQVDQLETFYSTKYLIERLKELHCDMFSQFRNIQRTSMVA